MLKYQITLGIPLAVFSPLISHPEMTDANHHYGFGGPALTWYTAYTAQTSYSTRRV
jgi:hypothetical protein